MPKQVDHDQRRAQIADALQRLITRHGLEGVSLRHVAAEAGVSMGSVQHYFASKDEMLLFTLEHRNRQREERIRAQVLAGGEPTPKRILRACLVEMLPRDERSAADWLVGVAFFNRAVVDARLAEVYAEGVPQLHEFFAGLIRQAQEAGDVAADVDADHESAILWALADSQGSDVLLGHRSADDAVATVDYHLDRLFTS
ncbi:TetR/AcrR family transcriptional regulator [Amycolatopsis sp. NPDC051903]|uniref:TetR/AcrR family transcriptional regulator n=1 Tax=Amycolatopsis sp. NPDC051903 TaxID=3363936 RepID=UPI0037B42053